MYTIKKRQFTALKEKDKLKRDKLNSETITSEYLPSYKYQLICLNTEFIFRTKKECINQLRQFDILP